MTKDEALTMCLEYIETNKHERKYVRHAIKAALEQAEPPPEWEAVNNIIAEYGLQAIDFVAGWKAAQRKPLTDEEIDALANNNGTVDLVTWWRQLARATEAAHGIKEQPWQEAAITAIKEALAQPVQEPVACRFCHDKKGCWAWQCYKCGEIDDVQKPAAPPKQEPVAWEHHEYRPYGAPGEIRIHAILASQYMMPDGSVAGDFQWLVDQYRADKNTIKLMPLYTTPPAPQREWVGLTHDQTKDCIKAWDGNDAYVLCRAIEAKLKERNT